MTKPIVISVEDLVLKEFELEDAESIFALIDRNRAHLSQFGEVTSEKYPDLKSVAQSIVNPPNRNKLRFGIWNDEFVGSINLSPNFSEAQFGYYLGAEFQGNGYMVRSLRALMDFASGEGYEYGVAYAHKDNLKSIAVFRRVGMKFNIFVEDKVFYSRRLDDKCLDGFRILSR